MSAISSIDELEDEIELLKSLEQIRIGINLGNQSESSTLHPITNVYNNLGANITIANNQEFDFVRNGLLLRHDVIT